MLRTVLDFLYAFRGEMNSWPLIPRTVVQLVLLLGVTVASYFLCRIIFNQLKLRLLRKGRHAPIRLIFLNSKLIPRFLLMIPLVVSGIFVWTILNEGVTRTILITVNRIFFYFVCAHIFAAMLSITYRLMNLSRGVDESPQKGIFQVLSVLGYIFATVAIVAYISGHDPTYIISGMTALSAVLMLVFKDSILGLTAGITLASNGMIRMGDWIEVPGTDADGNVIDMTLTSVRVMNWDNTVTTVPAYNLIASPFKNWRNMFEKGGRRIKRSIWIDVDSVAFATDEMLERWKKINILRGYLAEKMKEIQAYNETHSSPLDTIANTRKLTNIGTFRAYCLAYIKSLQGINKRMTIIVRQMQPTDCGLPLEIYCFTADTSWETYERVQSDIFDHLLAIMPEFGLRYFQVASAAAMRSSTLSLRKEILQ